MLVSISLGVGRQGLSIFDCDHFKSHRADPAEKEVKHGNSIEDPITFKMECPVHYASLKPDKRAN